MPADPEDPDPQTSGSLDPEPDPMGSDPRIQAPPCEKGVAPQITEHMEDLREQIVGIKDKHNVTIQWKAKKTIIRGLSTIEKMLLCSIKQLLQIFQRKFLKKG